MIQTIISNNCVGGLVSHMLGMEFKSPTVNLQILPEQFPKFCDHIEYYMNTELNEIFPKDFDNWTNIWMKKMYGTIPLMPFGIIDDIIICFQHYNSFEEAKQKWDERKKRIDYDNIGYIFHVKNKKYTEEAINFMYSHHPNSLILSEGFDLDGAIRFDPPQNMNAYSIVNGLTYITQVYDYKKWREQG